MAILGTSTVEYALVFLAAMRAGGVAAPLTTSASPEQLEGMAKDSGAAHLFIDAAKAAELGPDFMANLIRVPLESIDQWMAPPRLPRACLRARAQRPVQYHIFQRHDGHPQGDRPFAPDALAAVCFDWAQLPWGRDRRSFACLDPALF